jgi:outer membrane protein assembly factor BamA
MIQYVRLLTITATIGALSTLAYGSDAAWPDADTTKSRDVERYSKSTGEKIADIPGEILKIPIKLVRWTAQGLYYGITKTPFSNLSRIDPLPSSFYPVFGYSSQVGLRGGLGYAPRNVFRRGDFLRFEAAISTNVYQNYEVSYQDVTLFGERTGVEFDFIYRKRPRERFYGVGNDSKRENEANYELETTDFLFRPGHRFSRKVSGQLLINYNVSNTYDGKDPNLQGNLDSLVNNPEYELAPDQFRSIRYFGLGFSIAFDSRDNAGQPSKGNFLNLAYLREIGVGRSDGLQFNYVRFIYAHYFNLWRKRILVARLFLQGFSLGDQDGMSTPVYLLNQLGGLPRLRGYRTERFIDNDVAVVSLEYRWPVWKVIDAFLFWDEGRVYNDLTNEAVFVNWKYSFGGGFRVRGRDQVSFMILLGASREGVQFYFEAGAEW